VFVRAAIAIQLSCCLLAAFSLQGADKKAPPKLTETNNRISLTATLYTDSKAIEDLLGAPLNGDYIVIDISAIPKGEEPMRIDRDQFTLLSYKDGQRSEPFSADQIAGSALLVVSPGRGSGSAVAQENRGPVWGGMGGPMGRIPGRGDSFGNTGSHSGMAETADRKEAKENPLRDVLEQKIMPQQMTKDPVSGLLIFPITGKHKPKDFVLMYKGPAGKLSLEFEKALK
jgi:hypothetical protein